MKMEWITSLLVGITFVTLGPATWAAGQGGSGGFHGGGGVIVGHVGGGVGTRGGGVGFGGARFSGGVPNFAGAGSRFSSFGHPSSRQPVFDGRPSRSMPRNIARNGNAIAFSRTSIANIPATPIERTNGPP